MTVGSNADDLMKAAARARANQKRAQDAAREMSQRIKGNPPPPPKPAEGQGGGEAK